MGTAHWNDAWHMVSSESWLSVPGATGVNLMGTQLTVGQSQTLASISVPV